MAELTIITNGHEREVIGWHMLTDAERAEFDYIDAGAVERGEEAPEFVRYRGEVHDLDNCEGIPPQDIFPGWDQYRTDSFFSGVLFRWVREDYGDGGGEVMNGDYVVCGRYYS